MIPAETYIALHGSYHNIRQMQEILDSEGIKLSLYEEDGYSDRFGCLSAKNMTEKYMFLKYMYDYDFSDPSNVCFKRKLERANDFFNFVENSSSVRQAEKMKAIQAYKNAVFFRNKEDDDRAKSVKA